VFKEQILRKLSRMEKKKRKVCNEKFQDPCASTYLYINRAIESRRIRWTRQPANIRVRYVTVFDGKY